MKDQVENQKKLGISAISLSDVKDGEAKDVEDGYLRLYMEHGLVKQ